MKALQFTPCETIPTTRGVIELPEDAEIDRLLATETFT